jgi:protein-L-isoaspartate(D-aspartate) O-methyltransferase
MVQPGGKVVGIEHLPELSAMSTRNLVKDPEHKKMIDDGDLLIVTGDGRKGYPEEGMCLTSHLSHLHPDPVLGF